MSEVDWGDLAEAGKLGTRRPEEVVQAYRQTGDALEDRVRGKLLQHLATVARRHLMRGVNRNMPNGGLDDVEHVISRMSEAIIDPKAKDGAGYEASFFRKLEQRLLDRHRRWRRDQARTEPLPTDEETGEMLDSPDGGGLNPEDIAMADSLIASLPDKLRRAFLLDRAGYSFSSQGTSISSLLKVTPKTADRWVKEAKALLLAQMGRTR